MPVQMSTAETASPEKPAKGKRRARAAKKAAAKSAAGSQDETYTHTYTYTLPVEPSLFGRLRIRCWAEGEVRPP